MEELHDIPTWFLTAGTYAEKQISVWFTCTEKSQTEKQVSTLSKEAMQITTRQYYLDCLGVCFGLPPS